MNKQNVVSGGRLLFKRVLPKWLVALALGLQIAVVAMLLVLSIFFTVTFKRVGSQLGKITEQVDYHSGIPSAVFIVGTIMLFVAIVLLSIGISKLPRRWVFATLLAYAMIIQTVWIVSLSLVTYTYPDSQNLMDAANALLRGDIGQFSADYCSVGSVQKECIGRDIPSAYAYFSFYPFQSGPMLWYLLVFALFGSGNILAFQIASAVAVTAMVAVLWRLSGMLGLDKKGYGAFTVLIATCVPLMMFAAFVYPNAVGFFITICGVWIIAEGFRLQKVWSSALAIAGGFLVCGIGIIFKSTYQIVVLAALLAAVFAVWHNRRIWQLLVSLLSAVITFVISKLPVALVQSWTGQNFGKGMPMLSWIAIGLSQSGNMPPGWWNRFALDAFERTGNDYALQSQISKEFIQGRLSEFSHNPGEGMRFFIGKLASEWAEPSFMTSLYSELGESSRHFAGLSSFLLIGDGSDILLRYENVARTVMYLLACIGLIALLRSLIKEKTVGNDAAQVFARVLLCASFIGGFLCYLLWEAKGIYTFPFFLLLIPMAAYGIQKIVDFAGSLKRKYAAKGQL